MTDMDTAERALEPDHYGRDAGGTWHVHFGGTCYSGRTLHEAYLDAIRQAHEKGRQAGLEEAEGELRSRAASIYQADSFNGKVDPGPISAAFQNDLLFAARAVAALKDKPEGGQ